MLISVIIPCYNSENILDNLLQCFEHQTIGIENIEMIFVDDCSTDATVEKLDAFKCQYPQNVIVSVNACNSGVSYLRNRG